MQVSTSSSCKLAVLFTYFNFNSKLLKMHRKTTASKPQISQVFWTATRRLALKTWSFTVLSSSLRLMCSVSSFCKVVNRFSVSTADWWSSNCNLFTCSSRSATCIASQHHLNSHTHRGRIYRGSNRRSPPLSAANIGTPPNGDWLQYAWSCEHIIFQALQRTKIHAFIHKRF